MRNMFFLCVVIIAGILQVTVLDYFKIFGIKPDVILISAVISALSCPLGWSIPLSVLGGIFKDVFSASVFGINTLLLPLWSFLIFKLSRKIPLDVKFMPFILIFIVAIINALATRLILLYLGSPIPLGIYIRIALLGPVYTALISPILFRIVRV